MAILNLAVVGPGLIGTEHIRLINQSNLAGLAAIIAPDTAENAQIVSRNNVPLFSSIEDCLSSQVDATIDGIIIASPNQFHFDQAKCCIEASIPALIEKPITSLSNEAREIVKLTEEHNAKILVGHHRAHSPILARAKSTIESGRLGKLVSVIGSAQFYKPADYFEAAPWRKESGGGPILINLIHEVHSLRSLIGEISSVQAMLSSKVRNFSVEDTVAINFCFESGALGTFLLSDTAVSSTSWEQTSGENPVFPHYANDNCYIVSGTLGSLSVPTMKLQYFNDEKEASWLQRPQEKTITFKRLDPLSCQFNHFIDVIKGKCKPLVSAFDGYMNLLIIEAIKKSALTQSTIHIKDFLSHG